MILYSFDHVPVDGNDFYTMYSFVYQICKSFGKYFLYFKRSVH